MSDPYDLPLGLIVFSDARIAHWMCNKCGVRSDPLPVSQLATIYKWAREHGKSHV